MKTILAIDDQKDNLTTINAVVKSYMPECKVITAMSGKEGIEIAKKEQIDTILLDIIMPRMDGYEVCEILKANKSTRYIPIILITAVKTDSESRIKGLELGADAFLSKPIDAAEFIAQLKVMLRIKEVEDKLRDEKQDLHDLVEKRTYELEERESHFRAIINQATDAMFLVDFNGNIIEVNKKAFEFLGYTNDELLTKKLGEIDLSFNDIDLRNDTTKRLNNGESIIFESEFERKNETTFPVEISVGLIELNDKKLMLAFARNITRRKKAELEIKVERDKLNAILEAMQEGIYIINKDYEIQYVNTMIINEFGPVGNKLCYEYFHDSNKPCSFCTNDKVFAGESVRWEWMSPKNGKTYDLIDTPLKNSDGSILKFEIFRDITDMKNTQNELKMHKENLEEIVKERIKDIENKNEELARLNNLFVGREFRIKELRDKVKDLENK